MRGVKNSAALHKTEAEDGDGVYYLESTNELVIVSTDGYIRTFLNRMMGSLIIIGNDSWKNG